MSKVLGHQNHDEISRIFIIKLYLARGISWCTLDTGRKLKSLSYQETACIITVLYFLNSMYLETVCIFSIDESSYRLTRFCMKKNLMNSLMRNDQKIIWGIFSFIIPGYNLL